jgi:hypothetical protein
MAKNSNFDFSVGIIVFLAIVWLTGWFILPYIAKHIERFYDLNTKLEVAKDKRKAYLEARKELLNQMNEEEHNLAIVATLEKS